MNASLLREYKRLRKDYTATDNTGKPHWITTPANRCLQDARVNVLFAEHEDDEVKLEIVPDEYADIDDLLGDVYSPKANPDISPYRLKTERDEEIERINRLGVWGIVSYSKCPSCGEWKQADSVWGFVGEDWKDSGYDVDVKRAALMEAGLL